MPRPSCCLRRDDIAAASPARTAASNRLRRPHRTTRDLSTRRGGRGWCVRNPQQFKTRKCFAEGRFSLCDLPSSACVRASARCKGGLSECGLSLSPSHRDRTRTAS